MILSNSNEDEKQQPHAEVPENELTPEQASARAEYWKAKRAEMDAAREKNKTEFEKVVAQHRETNRTKVTTEAIGATAIDWYDPENVMLLLTNEKVGGFRVEWSNSGDAYKITDREGRPVDSLETAIEKLALSHPYLCDPTSTAYLQPRDAQGRFTSELAKSDFANWQQRSRWIAQHSLEEFEKLPLRREPQTELATMTAAQYRRLPYSKKASIAAQIGEAGISAILKRR